MDSPFPCSICSNAGHSASRCSEIAKATPPAPQRGEHGEDDSLHESVYQIQLQKCPQN